MIPIRYEFKVLITELKQRFDGRVESQPGRRIGGARQLDLHLLQMIEIQVSIT
jgi:hypothetical protein